MANDPYAEFQQNDQAQTETPAAKKPTAGDPYAEFQTQPEATDTTPKAEPQAPGAVSQMASKADEAVTGFMKSKPTDSPVAASAKTLGREMYEGGKTLAGMVPGMYHAFVDEPQTEEEKKTAEESPVLGRAATGLGRIVVDPIKNAAEWYKQAYEGKIPNAYEQALSVAPEAMGSGAGNVVAGKLGEMGVEKAPGMITKGVPLAKEVATAPLRAGAKAINMAKANPEVTGAVAGGMMGAGHGPIGVGIGAVEGARGGGMFNRFLKKVPDLNERIGMRPTAEQQALVGNEYVPTSKEPIPAAKPGKPRIEYAEPTPGPKEAGLVGNEYAPPATEPTPAAKTGKPRIEYAEPTPYRPVDKEITSADVKSTPGTSMSPEGKAAAGDQIHVDKAKEELGANAPTDKVLDKAQQLKEESRTAPEEPKTEANQPARELLDNLLGKKEISKPAHELLNKLLGTEVNPTAEEEPVAQSEPAQVENATPEQANAEVENRVQDFGKDAKLVGSRAVGTHTENSDVDVKVDSPVDPSSLEDKGYVYQGESKVSPKEAAEYDKPIDPGWNTIQHFISQDGKRFDVWSSEVPEAKETEAPKTNEDTAEKTNVASESKVSPEDTTSVNNIVKDLSEQDIIKAGKRHGIDHEPYDFKKRDENRHRVDRDRYAKDVTAEIPDEMKQKLVKAAEAWDNADDSTFTDAERNNDSRAQRARAIWDKAHEEGFNPSEIEKPKEMSESDIADFEHEVNNAVPMGPTPLKELREFVSQHSDKPLKFLSAGGEVSVFDLGNGKVMKVGKGEVPKVPDLPEVLQPLEQRSIPAATGEFHASIYPKLETEDIPYEAVKEMNKKMDSKGYDWDYDPKNLGRTPDGEYKIIDAGAVKKKPPA